MTQPKPDSLNAFHAVNTARQHEAFAPAHSLMELSACVQEEVGELAGCLLGITGAKKRKAHKTKADALDGVADAITYLSLVAAQLGCEDLEKLLGDTFNMVSRRAGSRLFTGLGQADGTAPKQHRCPNTKSYGECSKPDGHDGGCNYALKPGPYLDEQRAAGQAPVAAVGQPRDGYKQDMSRCRCSAPHSSGYSFTCLNCGDHLPGPPVAAPPAQPARDESCQECGVVGGGHRFECMARYKQPAQPTAVEPSVSATALEFVIEHRGVSEPRTVKDLLARDEAHVQLGRQFERLHRAEAAEPAVPVAGEPACECSEMYLRRRMHHHGCPRADIDDLRFALRTSERALSESKEKRDAALSQVETLQAGKLEAERVAAELKAELREREPVAGELTLGEALERARRMTNAATEAINSRDRVHYRLQEMTAARDTALSQVEALQAGKLEAERVAAELKAELRERDQREASLRDDVAEARANAEARSTEFQMASASLTAAKEQVEALTKELADTREAFTSRCWDAGALEGPQLLGAVISTIQSQSVLRERAQGLQRQYDERDEELQKLDDLVVELGGEREQGPAAFLKAAHKQAKGAVKAKNEAEALRGELGAAVIDNETLEKERDMARASLTAEKERAGRLESRVKELRVYAFTFRKSKRDERICCNCEEPRHGHYSGPGAEPGIVYCSKYDVPQAPPSVATGERGPVSAWDKLTADCWSHDPPATPTPLTESGNEMLGGGNAGDEGKP